MAFNYLKHTVCSVEAYYTDALSDTVNIFFIAVSVVIMAVLLILLIVRLVLGFNTFKRNIKYINMEIRRTRGSERKAWQKEKRRLWLSLIPFYKR